MAKKFGSHLKKLRDSFGRFILGRPEIIKIPVVITGNEKSKEVLIEGDHIQLLLYRRFIQIHINYIYQRPVREFEDEDESDAVQDEYLKTLIGKDRPAVTRVIFHNAVIRKKSIQAIEMTWNNDDKLYCIGFDVKDSPCFFVSSIQEGREVMLKLHRWWLMNAFCKIFYKL